MSAALDEAKVARIKARMLACFQERPHGVSFVNLRDAVGLDDYEGNHMLTGDQSNALNIFWWADTSGEFGKALRLLLDSKTIEMRPTHVLTYMIDGCVLNMPLVGKRTPTKPYKERRWIPIAFNLAGASI